MPKNKIDPKLKIILKDGENIKKKANKLIKDGNSKLIKFEKKKLSEKEVENFYQKCLLEKTVIEDLIEKLQTIVPVDDTINKEIFDEQVLSEIKRQKLSIDEIDKIIQILCPQEEDCSESEIESEPISSEEEDGITENGSNITENGSSEYDEDDYNDQSVCKTEPELLKTNKTAANNKLKSPSKPSHQNKQRSSLSDDSQSISDEDEDTTKNDEVTINESMKGKYVAIGNFEGQMEGDMNFKSGDLFNIISSRSDGWLNAVKISDGKKGLVPKNYIEKYNEDDYDDDDDDENIDSQAIDDTDNVMRFKDNDDVQDSTDEDISDNEDSTYIDETEISNDDDLNNKPLETTHKSGKELWANIKKGVKNTKVKDILNALGSLPMGFCSSTLAPLQLKESNRLKGYLIPSLNTSNLGYKDLFFDVNTDKLKSYPVCTQRIVTVTQIRQMPILGQSFTVIDRFVRICLFDGHSILSNIITIKVSSVDKDQKTWNFSNKIYDTMRSLEYSEFFIRTNSLNTKLGILFEASLTFMRNSSENISEISCGWVNLPLFDADPKPVANRTYDTMLNGGTCFEHGQLIDPNLQSKNEGSVLRNLMFSNKQPHICIRLTMPTKQQKLLLDTLPETLVASSCYMQYISLYRDILSDSIVRDRLDLHSTDLVYGPLLSNFPIVCDQTDLMDVLRGSWSDFQNKNKRSLASLITKREPECLKEQFRNVFMKSVYPMLNLISTLPYSAVDNNILQTREAEFKQLKLMNKNTPCSILTSASNQHKPFDLKELCFNPIGPHCLGAVN